MSLLLLWLVRWPNLLWFVYRVQSVLEKDFVHKIIRAHITFTFIHLADAFIQSDLLRFGYTFNFSVCVFPGIEPTTFCTANAMLYHWATGTCYFIFDLYKTLFYTHYYNLGAANHACFILPAFDTECSAYTVGDGQICWCMNFTGILFKSIAVTVAWENPNGS